METGSRKYICDARITSGNRITLCKEIIKMLSVELGDKLIVEKDETGTLVLRKA